MPERLVVIGGDAAGMTAASQARRMRKADDLEIIVFEQSAYVSFSACGEPYFVGGWVEDFSDLQVRTPEQFQAQGIDARIHHQVTDIDLDARRVTVRHPGGELEVEFDQLLYATGATAIRPPIEGMDLEGVHMLRTLDDAARLRALVTSGIGRAVVVGGGYIGLEVAEAFEHMGIDTTVVTMMPTVLERTLDPDMADLVSDHMKSMGIHVETGFKVECLAGTGGNVAGVGCEDRSFPADLVVLALGSRPQIDLAKDAGIPLGSTGAVAVNDHQRTGIDGVWAAGDCAEAHHRISGRPVNLHLGTVANKAGRIAGINLGGGDASFPGVLGTAITKVGNLEISSTGLTEFQAAAAGIQAVAATIKSTTAAHYWPGSSPMTVKAIAEKTTGRLLGAQIVGGPGAGKRIDVFATAMWSGLPANELAWTDLSYSPPFSGVWDPVHIAARKAGEKATG
jgi:NADPH-dependent 2,4-dienoyl-CoA reductase/sulfur reductase-like enzyme